MQPAGDDRPRPGRRDEFILALLPTATVLAVLGLVEAVARQRLLFALVTSSAFLIYLDPRHPTNAVRTLLAAQLSVAVLGLAADLALGPGYPAAAAAMIGTVAVMVLPDAVHPPAVSTALSFAFRAGEVSDLALFGLAVGMTALLVVLEWAAVRLLAWRSQVRPAGGR